MRYAIETATCMVVEKDWSSLCIVALCQESRIPARISVSGIKRWTAGMPRPCSGNHNPWFRVVDMPQGLSSFLWKNPRTDCRHSTWHRKRRQDLEARWLVRPECYLELLIICSCAVLSRRVRGLAMAISELLLEVICTSQRRFSGGTFGGISRI